MDKKNIRVIFNFTINNKDKRHNSNFNSKHYKNSNINNIDGEIWKPIKDFENIYYVSNKGRVKNIISNKLMSIFVVGNYYKVALKSKQYFVHKLVANAFIPNYDNKPCVDHIISFINYKVQIKVLLFWATIKSFNEDDYADACDCFRYCTNPYKY